MSKENVEIARTLYPGEIDLVAAFADPKLLAEVFAGVIHPDFEAVFEARNIPMGPAGLEPVGDMRQPTVRGINALIQAWQEWLSAWEAWVIEPTDFREAGGERVLVLMRVRARSKTHKVEMPLEGANLLTIRDKQVARLEMFLDQNEALEAAGLSR